MYYNDKTRQFHVFYFWLIKEKKIGFSVNVCIVSSVCVCVLSVCFVYLVKLATVTFWNACGLFEIPQRHPNPKYLFMAQLETNIHISKFRNSLCFSQLFRQTIFIHILFSIRMTSHLFYCIFVLPFSLPLRIKSTLHENRSPF